MVAIACLAIVAMMFHIVSDVVGKFLFNSPVEGTLEVVEIYYMVAVVYLPFAYVARGEGHIIVELFTRNLRAKNLARLETVIGAVTLVVMLVLTWKTGEDAVAKTILGEIAEAGANVIIAWPSRWLLPLGCGVMALAVGLRLIADAKLSFGPGYGTGGGETPHV